MSHLHLPDGIFPIWVVVISWLIAIPLLYLACHFVVRWGALRRVALLGVVTACVVLAMSVGVGIYHLNLLVLAGVLLGPALGFLTAFSASLLLALFGHGGLSLVGLNSIITGVEPVMGYFLFHAVRRRWPQFVRIAAALATVLALAISTTILVGVFFFAGFDTGIYTALERHDGERWMDDAGNQRHGHESSPVQGHGAHESMHGGGAEEPSTRHGLLSLLLITALLLWPLEAAANAFILHYMSRVRPALIVGSLNSQALESSASSGRHAELP